MWIADGHADTIWAAHQRGGDWTDRGAEGHADLKRLFKAGVRFQVFAVFSSPSHRGRGYTADALAMIERYFACASKQREVKVTTALTKADAAMASDEFKALLSIEGGEALQGSIDALRAFFRLGVRAMGLVWNSRNDLADGVWYESSGGGLTPFGRKVVEEMETLGMAVDVSHLSTAGFWDVAGIARRPFYASHSNAKAVCDHPRNLDDRQVKAVVESGGVIGVNFNPPFLTGENRATVDDVVRHIEHLVAVAGIDGVCLGSDFDGIEDTPEDLRDVAGMPNVARALLARGFSPADVDKVMGGNLVRFFERTLPLT